MKKTILLLPLFTLFACSESGAIAEELCNCAAPLLEIQNSEEAQDLDNWFYSLDSDDKRFLNSGYGSHSEDYDMAKHAAYLEFFEEIKRLEKKVMSCVKGISDKYDIKEGLSKETRIQLREQCNDVAEMLGI